MNITLRGVAQYMQRIIVACVWHILSSVDLFQCTLTYLMSVVFFGNFIAKTDTSLNISVITPGMHAYSDNCNIVQGFAGYDETFALYTSILFWFLSVPTLYEISNIVVPGMPSGIKRFDASSSEDHHHQYHRRHHMALESGNSGFESWFGFTSKLKLFSYASIDLIWATIADTHIQTLADEIPSGMGHYVKSIREIERIEEKITAAIRSSVVPIDGVLEEHHAARDDDDDGDDEGIVIQNSKYIAAIERPHHPTFTVEVSRVNGYIAMFQTEKLGRKTVVSENLVYSDRTLSGYKYILFKLNRLSGKVTFVETYDIYSNGLYAEGRGAVHLARELNRTLNTHVIVLSAIDSSMRHTEDGLPAAVYRCGGSKKMFGMRPLLQGYLLVGVPGFGESKGFEGKAKETSPELCANFCVLNSSEGFHIIEQVSTGRNYMRSSMAERTATENSEWKSFSVDNLPQYWRLCELEMIEFELTISQYNIASPIAGKIISGILAFCCVGHFLTRTGRRGLYVVLWKYVCFIQVVLGIWTDDLVDIYRIHDNVHQYSTVWDDPFVKRHTQEMHDAESEDDRKLLAHISPTSRNMVHRYKYYENIRKGLKYSESKMHLQKDYSETLYALIAPRATFLQLIPYVSVLAIFTSFTAGHPIFVNSSRLLENLHVGIEEKCYDKSCELLQDECDRAYALKLEEATVESYTIPQAVPPTPDSCSTTHVYNKRVAAYIALQKRITAKNENSRKIQSRISAQPHDTTFKIRKWEAKLTTFSLFLSCSRYIQYAVGVFKCILSIILLIAPSSVSPWMSTVTVLVLLPFSIANGMLYMTFVGKSMWITDEELYRELGWIVRGYHTIIAFVCRCCNREAYNSKESKLSDLERNERLGPRSGCVNTRTLATEKDMELHDVSSSTAMG